MKSSTTRIMGLLMLLSFYPLKGQVQTSSTIGLNLPTVGLSLKKHSGAVISKNILPSYGLLATVSEDRTLKIWEYPSLQPVKSINMPEARGYQSRLGECAFLNKDIVLVADNSGNEYEFLPQKDLAYSIEYGKDGAVETHRLNNVKSIYSFYAVDWRRGIIVDRAGSMSSPISSFLFSPNRSLLLVTTAGYEAVLYNTANMKVINEITFNDEEILGARFLSQNEFVIFTDLYFYKFKISFYSDVSFVSRKQIMKKRLKPIWGAKKVKEITFSDDGRYAYLYYNSSRYGKGYLYAVSTLTGEFDKLITPPVHADQNDEAAGRYMTIPDSLFQYRTCAAPSILPTESGLLLQYEGESVWSFTKDKGLCMADTTESEFFFSKMKPDSDSRVERVSIGSDWDYIKYFYKCIETENDLIYLGKKEYPSVHKFNGWSMVLPATAEQIERWVTPHHFLLSLSDGTVRWYNSHTGKEELSLFVTKDGEWIIWSPDGRYDQSSPTAGNLIEWRYQTFSRIEVKKPKDNRRAYCRPHIIRSIMTQLYDPRRKEISKDLMREISSLDEITQIDYVTMDETGKYQIDYSLQGYNPVQYGPYDVTLYFDNNICEQYEVLSYGNRGTISAIYEPDAELVEVVLKTEYKGTLAPGAYEINETLAIDSLWFTGIGINKYESPEFGRLKSSVNDANDISVYFFENNIVQGVKWINKLVLTDDKFSELMLELRLEEIISHASRKTLSVIYLSGHGIVYDDDFYYVLSDGTMVNVSSLIEQCSRTDGHFLFIIDACFSGKAMERQYDGIAVLSSSDSQSKSLDGRDELDSSVFTRVLKEQFDGIDSAISLDNFLVQLAFLCKDNNLSSMFYNNIGYFKLAK